MCSSSSSTRVWVRKRGLAVHTIVRVYFYLRPLSRRDRFVSRPMQLTFEQRRARRSLSTQLLHVETSNVVSMPDRVLTLAADPFLAPSSCMVARGSQDVRPSHASQNRSLQGNVCVREKHSLDSASTGGGSPPQPPRAATHLVRETQTARADTGGRGFAASRWVDSLWEVACCGDAHARLERQLERRLARAESWS